MNTDLWNRCIEYHGHTCGGIALGYMAAMYAGKLLDVKDGDDVHVLAATSQCPIDAFAVVLGCSRENGRLEIDDRGEMLFEIENRTSGKSVVLLAKPKPEGSEKGRDYWLSRKYEELFEIKTKEPADAGPFCK